MSRLLVIIVVKIYEYSKKKKTYHIKLKLIVSTFYSI